MISASDGRQGSLRVTAGRCKSLRNTRCERRSDEPRTRNVEWRLHIAQVSPPHRIKCVPQGFASAGLVGGMPEGFIIGEKYSQVIAKSMKII